MSSTPLKKIKKRILILAANPKNSSELRLGEEVREIDEGLKRALHHDQFELVSKWAVRPLDFHRHMLDVKPQIVHFSGHGLGEDGIVIEKDNGEIHLVSTNALESLFKLFASKGLECVLLNACFSEIQAEAISQHIPYVIGMKKGLEDKAAITFAVAFYDALGAGEKIEFAFDLACAAIQMANIPEYLIPVLKKHLSVSHKIESTSPVFPTSLNDLTTSQQQQQHLEPRDGDFQRTYNILSHTVLVDGITGSGKSSFIARLVCPAASTSELKNMTSTVSAYQSLDVPVCWDAEERNTLHSLSFFDVAGENSGTFIDALHYLSKERSDNVADVVLVVIWDISSQDKWVQSVNHFSTQRIKAAYGSKMAASVISDIIVFFNKLDLVDKETAQKRVTSAKEHLKRHLEDTLSEHGYGEIQYISGSVLEGTHMHDCLSKIMHSFGLVSNFQKVIGNMINCKYTGPIYSRGLNDLKISQQCLEQEDEDFQRTHNISSHTVLLDGIAASGKSSFIARLACPAASTSELKNMTVTVSAYQSLDVPVCWDAEERKILHSLRFFDVAGRDSGTFIDALHYLSKERSDNVADVILVVIWDISSQDRWLESVNHFSTQRIKAAYGSKMATSVISDIIVFFNKLDLVDKETAQKRVTSAKEHLERLFDHIFEHRYGKIYYISGSALKGTHMHDCLSKILRKFGVTPNFQEITGNVNNPQFSSE